MLENWVYSLCIEDFCSVWVISSRNERYPESQPNLLSIRMRQHEWDQHRKSSCIEKSGKMRKFAESSSLKSCKFNANIQLNAQENSAAYSQYPVKMREFFPALRYVCRIFFLFFVLREIRFSVKRMIFKGKFHSNQSSLTRAFIYMHTRHWYSM